LNSQFPTQYQGSQYIIDEGNEPKLPAPPRGNRWVLSSGYYQLVPVQ
jgi:Ni/Co efflux regulator RcnB